MNPIFRKIQGLREMLSFDNGISVALDRLMHPAAQRMVYRLGDLEIVVDRAGGDISSIRACLATPMYRAMLHRIQLPEQPKVLDLGANVGGFSLLLHAMGFRPSRLVAVELNPNTSIRLRYNLATNLGYDSAVQIITAGIAGTEGRFQGRFGAGSTGDCIENAGGNDKTPEVEVPLKTVDGIIEEHFGEGSIDLCKIDIEGAEHSVFEQPNFRRLSQVVHLVIEVHDRVGHTNSDILEHLGHLGFTHQVEYPSEASAVHLFSRTDRSSQPRI